MEFDFSKEPGKKLNKIKFENIGDPIISVIMPYYNDKDHIEQSVTSLLNQTFPNFELIIINDGSTDKESVEKLDEIVKMDSRIRVLNKENGGASESRDYGVARSSEKTKYILLLDSDDLIEPTYLECAYWTLETNPKASWAFTDSVGFDSKEYTWNRWYDSEKMKKENDPVILSLINKEAFLGVNGFDIHEKNVYEDWNLWLKLLAQGKYPVRMNFYGCWYRVKKESELHRARANHKRAMEIINTTAKTLKKRVEAIQYPKFDYDWDLIPETVNGIIENKKVKDEKINILMIIPWMIMGGADKFNLDLISRLDPNKYEITIISTEPAVNIYRQQYRENAIVYDLSTFLNQKYWISFINYIIKKNNIDIIFNTNSETGYSMLPYIKAKYPETPIIDYIHMEEWYNRNGGYSRDSSCIDSVIDKTLTCNENSTKILRDYFGREEKSLKTVYIGVDEKKFNPEEYDKEKAREKYGVDKKYSIGFICRITEQKRPFLLLQTIKKLKEERDDFVVLVAGTGNLFSKVKNKANQLGISENIKFLGNVSETQEFYAACDLTLNCSLKEGLALTSYESLAMGVPVISSDVGGQKELINEDTGIIIPCMQDEEDIYVTEYKEEEICEYVKAIKKVINNIDTYKANCRKRILNGFTIDQMVENMSKIFEDAINNPDKDKIESGKGLSKNINITKELYTKEVVLNELKYQWECDEYNMYYGYQISDYKFQLFKEKMWKHSWYRALIKILKKMGIIKAAKKISNR